LNKLLIISHTEHFIDESGIIVGWGPTINEINYISDYFDEIVHIACLHNIEATNSSVKYTSDKIKFVPISPFGGVNIKQKIGILTQMPSIISKINQNIHGVTHIQLRLPMGIGIFLLPYFSWFKRRNFKLWIKYAGNWNDSKMPLGFYIQKQFLILNFAKAKVTINGFWDNQPKHCFSFENPCLTNEQIQKGKDIIKFKKFNDKFKLIFVGRLEEAKGLTTLLDALENYKGHNISEIVFIGDGPNRNLYQSRMKKTGIEHRFLGARPGSDIHQELLDSHFILLPSKQEGFPKVIAEAACYGVISITSNVGSISHYINKSNGFVWDIEGLQSYRAVFNEAMSMNEINLNLRSKNLEAVARLFTFDNYINKLNTQIFD
jgi:glycosyltransferase involved in cell wall biosynthesis